VTGASGFVGRVLLKNLATSPEIENVENLFLAYHKVPIPQHIVQRLQEKTSVETVQHDATQTWYFHSDMDVVVNLAADGTYEPYSPSSIAKFTSIGENMTHWLDHSSVVRIVHASSGICDYLEAATGAPILASPGKRDFAEGRRNVENIVREKENSQRSSRILRLYSFVGKELLSKPQYAINQFLTSAVERRTIQVRGNSGTRRSYLSEEDLGNVLRNSIFESSFPSLTSVGSHEAVTMSEVATKIAKAFQVPIIFSGEDEPVEDYFPEHSKHLLPSLTDLRYSWDDTIQTFLADLSCNSVEI